MLSINNLTVTFDNKVIIDNLSLHVESARIHALMGQNGSGKSTLALVLMGHPSYVITSGSILFDGVDITTLSPEKRARQGLFLAFQHPYALPGVYVRTFLKESYCAVNECTIKDDEFDTLLKTYCDLLSIDELFLSREVNVGFSGGERKRLEILQLLVLQPRLAILDEIDSGLDVDALKAVSRGILHAKRTQPSMSVILITHYQRILNYVVPDTVHIVHKGYIAQSGRADLAQKIERMGYNGIV